MEDRFGGYLSSEFDETLTPDCVATTSFDDEPLRSALLQDLDEAATWATEDELQPQLLDAARGCVSEITFAAMAGLDDPRELASVMIVDPFAKYDDVAYQNACVVEAVVTAVGIERLAELEITVDEPELSDRLGDLEGAEHDEIAVELRQCEPRELVERLVEGNVPQVVDCVSNGLDDDEVSELVSRAVAGRTIIRQDPLRDLIDTCTADRVVELFGPEGDHSSDVRFFVNGLIAVDDVGSTNEFEYECVEAGFLSETSDETLVEIEPYLVATYEGRLSSQSSFDSWTNLMRSYSEVTQVCLGHWAFITADLELAGVSESSWPCIELQLDPESVTYARELFFEAVWEASPSGLNRLEDLLEEVGEIVQDCGTGSDRASWNRYMDDVFGSSEPLDEIEAPQST